MKPEDVESRTLAVAKLWTGRALLAFVLLTAGFALGRRASTGDAVGGSEADSLAGDKASLEGRVVVYAVHTSFRCADCNRIEWLTEDVIERDFAGEVASGKLEYRTLDFMKNDEFARRYDISSSVVIVSRIETGEETDFERLDEVWTRLRDQDDFMRYVSGAIRRQLDLLP